MSDITESITNYIYGYQKRPSVNDLPNMTDKFMTIAGEMDEFFNNIPDDKKRESMKLNVSMSVQLMVDNLETYNDWLMKKAREEERK